MSRIYHRISRQMEIMTMRNADKSMDFVQNVIILEEFSREIAAIALEQSLR